MWTSTAGRVPRPVGLRLYATPIDEPRARRATDGILLVSSLFGLAVLSWLAAPPAGVERSLARFVSSLPLFLAGVWQLLLGLVVALPLAVFVAALVRRRWSLARDLVVAAALAIVTTLVVGRVVLGAWPSVLDSLRADAPPPWFPSARLAVAGAVILTASPHLTRPVRRLGRRVLGAGALAAVMLGAAYPLGALAGVLVAVVAAAAVHLLFGSSGGRPGLNHIATALVQLGVHTRSLQVTDRQPAGVFLVEGEDSEGRQLLVKAYGRDAHDTQLLATLWRTVWFRDPGAPAALGRLRQVEHEAFLTLMAGQAGIPTEPVVTAGSTVEDDALLVLRPIGAPIAAVGSPWTDADLVDNVWGVVQRLHRAGIVHGQLDAHHLIVVDDRTEPLRMGLVGFRGATVGPEPEQVRADEAQAIVTTALLVGDERALAGALDALGPAGLTAALPFLQETALTGPQRAGVKDADLDLDQMRTRAAELAGVDPPDLQRLRRVTVGTIVQLALVGIAAFALVSAASGVDLGEMRDQFAEMSWQWVLIGALVAQTPRLSQAVSTLGASPIPLPLGHLYALQLAVSYVNLAIPASAARVAVNVRFFQRHGLPPGAALAVGALDGFGGFVVQIGLLLGLLTLTSTSLDLDLDADVAGAGRVLLLIVAIVAAVALVVACIRPLRRRVVTFVTTLATEAFEAARGLRSPRRLGLLLGGNLATEILFACALGCFTRAFGYPIGLDDLLLINLSVSLLSGLIPVPGGIGVTEAGLTYGLVAVGMPEETAFAAVLLHRLAAFYLPPIWGFFAFRWLERNHHL